MTDTEPIWIGEALNRGEAKALKEFSYWQRLLGFSYLELFSLIVDFGTKTKNQWLRNNSSNIASLAVPFGKALHNRIQNRTTELMGP